MDTPDNKLFDLLDVVRSWIPRMSEPANVSRDFWMPDQSCRVCYECDSQFNVFNRRHHCRLCGLVFCAKCTANTVPASSDESRTGCDNSERIRVCNYCFKQWELGVGATDNGTSQAPSPGLSPSPSAKSLASTKSSFTCNCSSGTVGSTPYSTGPYQHMPCTSCVSPRQSEQMDSLIVEQENVESRRSTNSSAAIVVNSASDQFGFSMNRSDDEDDNYRVCPSDLETRHYSLANNYCGDVDIDEIDHNYRQQEVDHGRENVNRISLSCSEFSEKFDTQGVEKIKELREEAQEGDNGVECEAPLYDKGATDYEPLDFENYGLLWIPPEPEDEEDEREAILFDDEDDEGETGEWGFLRTSNSFSSGEYRCRDKSGEEHRKAMKNVVEGHFRALVAQLLQVENLLVGDENDRESWLEIITSLSWEAATLLKPDMSKGGGMDPGGYVKVKCIACGRRSESMVIKGVVCKKNMAHRRMTSKIDKPRFLILGGALEYQRLANHLSSVDTLLQQEMDHLKMAVAKIDAYHPNVLLVEKSVSRYAQEYLLAKDISLVLNIKRPLLERIARCTGAQIVPSIDHLTSQKLGSCDMFHVEKFLEVHGSAGQGGKKLSKTLMFFKGCPKPLGCTILLKGANGDDLKKVKHVVQYAVFAAYHLALETSFLADEGALLLELPLKSPITVALPDKPSSIDQSISTVPGFMIPATGKPSSPQLNNELQESNKGLIPNSLPTRNFNSEGVNSTSLPKGRRFPHMDTQPSLVTSEATDSSISLCPTVQDTSYSYWNEPSPRNASEKEIKVVRKESLESVVDDNAASDSFGTSEPSRQVGGWSLVDGNALASNHQGTPELVSSKQDSNNNSEEIGSSKEEFPPSPSDLQSILVSLSTRCVWKGTVCERAHLFRIKYYGSFDKPLGRFLRDHLFDQSYCCRSCDMPSEAHVHCYTHQQGSLTISVKKLPEILLPGEREGKIWMWHRCLRCPRTNGFPPANRRVVMSDAAWCLSFGKFLELSFSNHAAASRVASCGHSLRRDCLRFYGFGKMVACFRYASVDVNSVYLPPPKLEFNYDTQDWIQQEANEVCTRAELLFTDVYKTLKQFSDKIAVGSEDGGVKETEVRVRISELEGMLRKDKVEFEESLQKALCKEVSLGLPAIDILEINKLRRQILFHSYIWDQRLIHAACSVNNYLRESFIPKIKERPDSSVEKLVEVNAASKLSKGFRGCNSLPLEVKPDMHYNRGVSADIREPHRFQKERDVDQDPNHKEADHGLSSSESVNDKPEPRESGKLVRRALSDGEFPIMANLSDTLDAAWTGENHRANVLSKENGFSLPDLTLVDSATIANLVASTAEQGGVKVARSLSSVASTKGTDNMENYKSWVGMPFSNFYSSFNKNSSLNARKLTVSEYNPTYVLSYRDLEWLSGARLLLPVGVNDTIVPVYDDEPTSVIAYALVSSDYHVQISEFERQKDADSTASSTLFDSGNLPSVSSFDGTSSDKDSSLGSTDEGVLSTSGSRGSQVLDPLSYTKDLHARISFTGDGPLGKVKYIVTCYYAKRFDALRRICGLSELDFIRSLSRCKKWGAQGGKSNVFFAKTLDDRFIIKQVTKTELESFIKFGPVYFKYLSESICTGSPTCLAKILGFYQVASKHLKGGKESKMDVLVMENLLFRQNITRLYDLKGSSRSRYNADTSGSNRVLLDQNLIEAMPTSPIFVGSWAKRLLERAVWNDTAFLASIDVMDYSLLVGVDEEKHELVLGIIDFMRKYTWDKHLETWVKTSGILGGPKNSSPTVISPQQYKKRFRKAMTAYFLMVPEQWTPP